MRVNPYLESHDDIVDHFTSGLEGVSPRLHSLHHKQQQQNHDILARHEKLAHGRDKKYLALENLNSKRAAAQIKHTTDIELKKLR